MPNSYEFSYRTPSTIAHWSLNWPLKMWPESRCCRWVRRAANAQAREPPPQGRVGRRSCFKRTRLLPKVSVVKLGTDQITLPSSPLARTDRSLHSIDKPPWQKAFWKSAMKQLDQQVAVITETANRGIGKAIATAFAAEGASLALCARNGDTLTRVADELRGQGTSVMSQTCDVSQEDDVQKFFAAVREADSEAKSIFSSTMRRRF